jgi:hypothetical protein
VGGWVRHYFEHLDDLRWQLKVKALNSGKFDDQVTQTNNKNQILSALEMYWPRCETIITNFFAAE